jgi:site-specific DNA-cytosine methylase
MYRAVDCLGFAGGFTLGTVRAGFELVGKRELPGGFGMPNCEGNRHLLGHNWVGQASAPEDWEPVDAQLVFGNPPCSGFSVMTAQAHRGMDAKVNHCMHAFAGYASRVRPLIAIFESVRPAYKMGRELMQKLRADLEANTGDQYTLYHVMHNAYELGGVAIRPRYFWVASRVPFGVEFPVLPNPDLHARDAWADLEGLGLTWQRQPYRRPPTEWSKDRRNDDGAVDGHVNRIGTGERRVYDLMEAANELGGWPPRWDMSRMARHVYETVGKLPPSWDYKLDRLIAKNFDTGFTTTYRWDNDRPGRVIVGGALSLIIHPTEDRYITHREAARVMGFPDDWLITPMRNYSGLRETWGKGISVMCGEWIAGWARAALDGNPGAITGEPVGDREYLIEKPKPKPLGKLVHKIRSPQEVMT